MKRSLREKLDLTITGYMFTLLNILSTLNGYTIVGIGFGLVSVYFFIKALRIKDTDGNS